MHSGRRRGETLALQWSDVDLVTGMLRVRGTLSRIDGELLVTEPKTAKSKRSVPISAPTERFFRACTPLRPRERLLPVRLTEVGAAPWLAAALVHIQFRLAAWPIKA